MRPGFSRLRVWAALACVLLPLALYWFVPEVRRVVGNGLSLLSEVSDLESAVKQLRDYLLGFGIWAPVASALLMVVQAVIAPIPAFAITFVNGLLFGWLWGAALSWGSAMLGAGLCFWLARALGRPVVEKLAGGSRALDEVDMFFQHRGGQAIVIARLLPFVPFDPVSYGAGLTGMRALPFLLATGIGQLPATLLYSWLGQSMTWSVRALFLLFPVLGVIAILGWILWPRMKKAARSSAEPPR